MVSPLLRVPATPCPCPTLEPALPVHKIPAYALHEDLAALEHDGESVVTITPIHDGLFFVVTTKFHGQRDGIELRAEWDGAR